MPVEPRCAYCRQHHAQAPFRPFCSERCKRADLGRWLAGDYRIPDHPVHESDLDDLEDESDAPSGHHH